MAKMGRPRKEINAENFQKLCKLLPTKCEVAGFFEISEDTLERRLAEIYGETFAVLLKRFGSDAKLSLRRHQFILAEKGNATMLIWLGKQWLGQTDKQELQTSDNKVKISFDDSKPIK